MMRGLDQTVPWRGHRALWRGLLATTMLTGASSALAQQVADNSTIETVVVTAEKRSEDLQKVALSIQALNTEKLEALHITDFNDFAKFLPSVSYKTEGPGTEQIYMRGVASGENANHSGPSPSVGMYLDEQPITTITGPLDVHIYDIARVESLAGPQGTLYGASSEAGTIRIITNKPDPSGFSASYDLEANTVAHGAEGYLAQGYVNVPVADNAAIRLVAWDEDDSGYIDNVYGTRTFPSSGITINNANLAKNNFNGVDTYGARAALQIDLNDNWTITPAIMAQDQKSNGIFGYDPNVGLLKVTHFYPDWTHDWWYQAALTIQGKISDFDVTYAGAYLHRFITSELDYSDYSFWYDTLFGYGKYITDNKGNLINPSQYILGLDRFQLESHELRIASPADDRLRFIAGLFYERQQHDIHQDYVINDLATSLSVPGWNQTIWLTQQQRVDRDYAAFGEVSFDITPQLTLTGGVRGFISDNDIVGFYGFGAGFSSSEGQATCFAPPITPASPCTDLDKGTHYTGETHKVNLSYKIDDDRMVYATYSTGFRPGGINRLGSLPPYTPDFLTNYEVGWKTTWLNDTLRFNGALYYDQWKNFQFSFLGPNGLTEIKNAGQASMKGLETDFNWLAQPGLAISGSASYTEAVLTENYCGTTDANGNPITNCADPQAPIGTQLPITSKYKGNITARDEFPFYGFMGHVQGSLVYQSSTWADLRTVEREILGRLPGYASADFSLGAAKDNYSFELFVQNAFDSQGNVNRYTECAIDVCGAQTYIVPIRPRLIGIRFSQSF